MNAHALKNRLPRTWGAFFGHYGNFTTIQLQAIPHLLEGRNVLLHAGTASGKTSAALAPLVERHLPVDRAIAQLRLLYLLPTRALINDLSARLASPLNTLQVSWATKTRDNNTFNPHHPPDILLTTPESLDSLMTQNAKLFIHVCAIVIDELHAFDAGIRGDQLRVLLRRLHTIRTYALSQSETDNKQIQYAALSATLSQPAISAARYFSDAEIVSTDEQRALRLESIPLEQGEPLALLTFLQSFRARGWKKALVFCNTRAEVEQYAAFTRAHHSPFGAAVYVHYSNLEPQRRQEIEELFAQAETAICFASSTLELGIDIGSIDGVMLIGPPGSKDAFRQRVGRANRRKKTVYVACFYRTALERVLFDVLISQYEGHTVATSFRPSVAIQQIFSLLKASPSGGIRLNPLVTLFAGWLSGADLEAIIGELQGLSYLKVARPGEWRAGERLNRLIDLQSAERVPLSIYSNLQINNDTVAIRDLNSQRVVAHVDRLMFDNNQLVLEGWRLNVEWVDESALWVSSSKVNNALSATFYRSARPVLNHYMTRPIPQQLGLSADSAPLVAVGDGWLWFHCLGDVYGRAILDLLGYTLHVQAHHSPALCLHLTDVLTTLPLWTTSDITRYVLDNTRIYERLLSLGAYHHLLPPPLKRRAVVEQFNVAGFQDIVRGLKIVQTEVDLLTLIDDSI